MSLRMSALPRQGCTLEIELSLIHRVASPHVGLLFGADLSGAAVAAPGTPTWKQIFERPNTHRLGQSKREVLSGLRWRVIIYIGVVGKVCVL
jgi:hypothetical protein